MLLYTIIHKANEDISSNVYINEKFVDITEKSYDFFFILYLVCFVFFFINKLLDKKKFAEFNGCASVLYLIQI